MGASGLPSRYPPSLVFSTISVQLLPAGAAIGATGSLEIGAASSFFFSPQAARPRASGAAIRQSAIRRKWKRFIEANPLRSDEQTSELQSLMRISYAVFCLKKKKT